jgi:N6-adenosine-specific RNA methylase IME4
MSWKAQAGRARQQVQGRPHKLMTVDLALLRPSPWARPINQMHVAELAKSIVEVGVLRPPQVRAIGHGGEIYEVIAGLHSIEAMRTLGWKTARVIDRHVDDLLAELISIDENVVRHNLTPVQDAIAMARRKVIYECLYPQTKAGIAGGKARQGAAGDNLSFAESTAKSTGKNRRTIERAAKRGADIVPDQLVKLVGTSLDKGDELDALAKLSQGPELDRLIDRAAAGEKVSAKIEVKKQARANRERELGAHQCALPTQKFGVIVADPEWRFEPWSRATGMDRAADNHYPTSVASVIAARDVASIAASDCVLFLWATGPMICEALAVMEAWGFKYKTQVIWRKPTPITGYWFRSVHELLLVGTRGHPTAPAMGTQPASVIDAPSPGSHSSKPEIFLEMIETYFPTLPKIELNRRGPARPSWSCWGNESEPTATGSVGHQTVGVHDPDR